MVISWVGKPAVQSCNHINAHYQLGPMAIPECSRIAHSPHTHWVLRDTVGKKSTQWTTLAERGGEGGGGLKWYKHLRDPPRGE